MTKMISYQYKFNTYLIIAQLPWGSGEALFKFSRCHLTFIVGKKKSYPGILQDISNDPIEGWVFYMKNVAVLACFPDEWD